jgi:hypothetical protein
VATAATDSITSNATYIIITTDGRSTIPAATGNSILLHIYIYSTFCSLIEN